MHLLKFAADVLRCFPIVGLLIAPSLTSVQATVLAVTAGSPRLSTIHAEFFEYSLDLLFGHFIDF